MKSLLTARIPLVASMAVTLLAVGLYAATGNPDIAGASTERMRPGVTTFPADDTGKTQKVASVDRLLTGLEERLRQDPDDGNGWLLLAKSYDHLDRTQEAAHAYASAAALDIRDADLEAKLANEGQSAAVRYPIDGDVIKSLDLIIE